MKTVDVLESREGMRTEADETDKLKGGGPWGGKAESANETKFGRHAGLV